MDKLVGSWPEMAVGTWFHPPIGNVRSSQHNNASSLTCSFPYVPAVNMSIDAMGVYTTGDAGATDLVVRVGLYAATSSSNPYPGARLFGSGDITANTAAIHSESFTAIALTAGTLYWMVTRKQNSPSNNAVYVFCADYVPVMPYRDTDSGATAARQRCSVVMTGGPGTGALPDPFTAGAVPDASIVVQGIVPFFKTSSVG